MGPFYLNEVKDKLTSDTPDSADFTDREREMYEHIQDLEQAIVRMEEELTRDR